MVKRSKVLQYSDDLSSKVSSIVRRHINNMKLLLMCILLLSYSLRSIFYQWKYGCIPVCYCNLCIFIVMFMYSYCMFKHFHRASWYSSATLTEVFPCFFLSCKVNARVKPAKTGHGPHSSKIFVLFYVLFVLCRSVLFVRKCELY